MQTSRIVSSRLAYGRLLAVTLISIFALPAIARTAEPWTKAQLVTPEQLSVRLADAKTPKPLILCVGFRVLYDAGHVPGSEFYGPASKPAGLEQLKKKLEPLPRGKEIVLYCGCCPVEECPNIRPAFEAARKMGFTHLKLLDLPTNFAKDWADKGFPIAKSN